MLILPAFYSDAELDVVDSTMRRIWEQGDSRIVVDDMTTNRRCLLSEVRESERGNRFKTNDLYLTESSIRELAIGERIAPLLETLLGQKPVLCNSLNFDQGSAQLAHIDSLYMTPHTRGHLCAIWVALEDALPEAGPLFFYRGSHKIPPYVFSDGSFHSNDSEMGHWHARMDRLLIEHGLKYETFLAKRGDVFVWSSDLVHGGSPIQDPSKTRKSVVFHYFSKHDCDVLNYVQRPMNGAFWIDRAPQPVPGVASKPARKASPKSGSGENPKKQGDAELQALRKRVAQLEDEVARLKRDPLRIRLASARARKWLKNRLARSAWGPGPAR